MSKRVLVLCNCKGRSHVCTQLKGLVRWNGKRIIQWFLVNNSYLVGDFGKERRKQ